MAEAWHTLKHHGFNPTLTAVTNDYLHIALEQPLTPDFLKHLGGTDRILESIAEQTEPWTPGDLAAQLSPPLPPRFTAGFSAIGLDNYYVTDLAKSLKRLLRDQGTKIQFILPQGRRPQLNAAQVIFNHLLEAPHHEFTVVKTVQGYILAKTIAIQDIQAYELRDTRRPSRDPKVGMLPPKLAQMMLNIAASEAPAREAGPLRIYDPFCGLGTLLQEGWLEGYQMLGSDSGDRMLQGSHKNLEWLAQHFPTNKELEPKLFRHNATAPIKRKFTIDALVTEPFLGKPISTPLPDSELNDRFNELGKLYHLTLRQIKTTLRKEGVVLIALPAFRQKPYSDSFHLFPETFLDAIGRIGYRRLQLLPEELSTSIPTTRGSFIYARPAALIGRELTLWRQVA